MSRTSDPVFFLVCNPSNWGWTSAAWSWLWQHAAVPSRSSVPRCVGGPGFRVFIGTAAPPVAAAALRGWSLLLSTLPRGRLEAAGSSDDGGPQSVEGQLAGLRKVQTPAEHSMTCCLCLPTTAFAPAAASGPTPAAAGCRPHCVATTAAPTFSAHRGRVAAAAAGNATTDTKTIKQLSPRLLPCRPWATRVWVYDRRREGAVLLYLRTLTSSFRLTPLLLRTGPGRQGCGCAAGGGGGGRPAVLAQRAGGGPRQPRRLRVRTYTQLYDLRACAVLSGLCCAPV